MYAFKGGLYEFLRGVHRKRLAGRIHMDPGTLSRVVNKNQRITEADLDRLIAAVQTSERTPPTTQEIVLLRRLHGRAELEADREGFEMRGLRLEREQAVRRAVELQDLLESARTELAQLRARTEQALQEDGEQATEDEARLDALASRVRGLEHALEQAVAAIIALEKRLAGLEQRLPDLADPTSMPVLADDPLRAARVLAVIPDQSERIATASRLVPELARPAGVLMFFVELLHTSGVETLIPVMEELLSTMPVGDLAAVLVAAAAVEAPQDEDEDLDGVIALLAAAASGEAPEDEASGEDEQTTDVQALLHDRVCTRLEARTFAALVHLLSADDHRALAGTLLAGGAQGPVHDVLEVSAALHALTAPYLQEATVARQPEGIAELAAALRTEDRDPDARTVLQIAGRRLRQGALAKLTDLLRALGRTHDLRDLQEGAALRDPEG